MPDFPWPAESGVFHTYDFHCHCGAVRWNMKISPPLYAEHTEGKDQYQPIECDCSICSRAGYIACHPKASNVTFTKGFPSNVSEYRMGRKIVPHWFCNTCASNIGADLGEVVKQMGGGEGRYLINLRMLKDFDRTKLNVKKIEGMKNFGPKYEID